MMMKDIIQSIVRSKVYAMLWLLLVLVFIACYYPTFQWLNFKYQGQDSYYSHGYLIPFITAYMIYYKREELSRAQVSGSPSGLWIIISALIIHILGVLGDIHFISGFSMILYIEGLSLYLLGADITKKISYPLSYLVFMCPVPDAFINVVALPAKSLSTTLSLHILGYLDIPFIREGFRIIFATSTYVVETPCNGMRSLISFLALGFLFIYFIRANLWKKMLFLVIIPPLSIFLNGIRIALLLYIANRYGPDAASPDSYLHDGSGILVFLVGLIVLMLAYALIHEKKSL
jgi:exosortase